MQASSSLTTTGIRVSSLAAAWPAFAVMALGLVIVYCIGFSNLPYAHNATHDTRHANGFPCH
ncbi:MAG TPA: CbtB domain-containing protein [Bryobacteraceae bacterium]|nr:CbtB domain-containing protein [Bryobacteraceae bacterium]